MPITILLLVVGVAALCVGPFLFMTVWNWIMPLFGIITLTFWQALGVMIILFFIGSYFRK